VRGYLDAPLFQEGHHRGPGVTGTPSERKLHERTHADEADRLKKQIAGRARGLGGSRSIKRGIHWPFGLGDAVVL
jgi:hypothetical protein